MGASSMLHQLAACWAFAPAAVLVLSAVLVLLHWAENRWRYRRVPGPFAAPIIGNLRAVAKCGLPAYLQQCREKYGRTFKIYLGSRMFVVVADPDLARKVMYKNINHNLGVQLTGDKAAANAVVATRGLFGAKDDLWRSLRLAWQPAFASASLEGYAALMDGCALRLAAALDAAADDGRPVDLWREVGKMTMSVVGTCAYGVEFNTMADRPAERGAGHDLVVASQRFFEAGMLSGSVWGRALLLFPRAARLIQWLAARLPDRRLRELTEARRTIVGVSRGLIRDWRASRAAAADAASKKPGPAKAPAGPAAAGGEPAPSAAAAAAVSAGAAAPPVIEISAVAPSDSEDDAASDDDASARARDQAPAPGRAGAAAASGATAAAGGGQRKAPGVAPGSFLDLMLDGNRKGAFDDDTVIAQSNTFILAGYETTANSLAYTLWAISAHPRVQERVLAEIDRFGRDREVTYADLTDETFPYLSAALKEAMRLYPAAPMTHREVTKPEGFELAPGLKLRQGDMVYTAMYCYQRDEEFWPAALEYRPERFLPEGAALAPRRPLETVFTPFGGGARLCVGYRFAQQEALITLVRLFQRFTFELQPGMVPLRVVHNLTMSPRDGVVCRVLRR